MDPFIANAESILDTARVSAPAGDTAGNWTILLGSRGEIEMIRGSDWALDALRTERGAAMAFRVGASGGSIAVDGCTFGRRCRLETETPAAVARRLLGSTPAYRFALPALPCPAPAA